MFHYKCQISLDKIANSTNTCPNCAPRIKIIELIEQSDRVPAEKLDNLRNLTNVQSDYTSKLTIQEASCLPELVFAMIQSGTPSGDALYFKENKTNKKDLRGVITVNR